MSEILAGTAVIGWIVALYCFIRLREARKEVTTWKKIAEDSRRKAPIGVTRRSARCRRAAGRLVRSPEARTVTRSRRRDDLCPRRCRSLVKRSSIRTRRREARTDEFPELRSVSTAMSPAGRGSG